MVRKHKTIDDKIDDLAIAVKAGFDEVGNRFTKLEKTVEAGFKQNVEDHEAIELRLTNVAYRFELVELEKRVEVLEKVSGIKSKH